MRFMRTMSICAAAIVAIAMAGPAAATADEAPPAKVAVWNYDVLGDAYRVTNPGPVAPVTLVGARNGTFSGAVAVQSTKPITSLRAGMGKLSMDGADIPAGQVAVRYAVSWGTIGGGPSGLDILLESPPATVAVQKDRALAAVWVTVTVPGNAKVGLYRGQLTVEAEGLPSRAIPVELTVTDWHIPDPQDQRTWIEMIQSPDTLALEYDVPLWSDRHWAMIAKSFQLMRPTGSRVVYIPLLRNTNQGNVESMVRWVRQKDESFKPDYAIMEKYLDLAQKHLGKLDLVVFYAWDVYLVRSFRGKSYEERPTVNEKAGNYAKGQQRKAQQRWDKRQGGLMVTMLDEKTGKTEPGHLPHYMVPESRTLWQPVYDELRKRMKRRGLEDAMVLGMVTDMQPSKQEVAFLKEVSGGLSWISHSHYRRTHNKPSPNTVLYGIAGIRYEAHATLTYQVNPDKGRLHGWQVPELRVQLDRFAVLNGSPLRVRQMPKLNITGPQRGLGRLGGDFWRVIRDKRGRRVGAAFGRYPENHWRGLNISSCFLAPGPDGPVGTSRLENLREGVQECEARILIESALLDAKLKQRLEPDLAKRAQAILNEHQRAMWRSIWANEEHLRMLGAISGRSTHEAIWSGLKKVGIKLPGFWDGKARGMRGAENRKGIDWFVASGWQQRNKQLFAVAAEVQQRLK
jgi:Glycoside hydrolase 123, catalytic domain/Glycoside hydrolase 123, N-terminal domain